jgi:hypothetical protein
MYSSPVRRFTNVLLRLLARLACIRRAASVHSEPGSNSHKGVLRIWTKGHHFNTLTPLLNILYSVVKEQENSSREPCTILRAQKACQGTLLLNLWPGIPYNRMPSPHSGTRSTGRNTTNTRQDNKEAIQSQEEHGGYGRGTRKLNGRLRTPTSGVANREDYFPNDLISQVSCRTLRQSSASTRRP